jgi:hypothetical protein
MIRFMLTTVALTIAGAAAAKLPALDDAAKAKAAEAAAKTAWQGKLDAYQLCKAQDRIAAHYKSHAPAKPGAPAGAAADAGAAPSTAVSAAAPVMTPTAAPATAAKPAAPAAAATSASASQGATTPVAAVAPNAAAPSCADPGPYAYAPAEQKPLETSGAHSPAANATSPPSVRAESAQMAPSVPGKR